MTQFSKQALKEEEQPVAVRSFSEARAGSKGSATLLPKTGEVTSPDPSPKRTPVGSEPRLGPLLGEVAVPKVRAQEFVAPRLGKKKPKLDTPETFGQVELRQATATGGRHIARAKPENLQRGASRIGALARAEEPTKGKKRRESESPDFEVQQQTASGSRTPGEKTVLPVERLLTDFGEIEIDQQTRSGARKVGRLASSEEESESDR